MDETTNEILNGLAADIRLEMNDAANNGQRVEAGVLQRVLNALERNRLRREERESIPASEELGN